MPVAGSERAGDRGYLECLGAREFVKDVFLDCDTDMMVLSFVPSARGRRAAHDRGGGRDAPHRRRTGRDAAPACCTAASIRTSPATSKRMDELAARWGICAWKTYTQFGPGGQRLLPVGRAVGSRFIEKARALGIKVICVHKGLPFGAQSYEHSQCSDIGKVAKQFPDVTFIVYHSGFVAGNPELAYDHAAARDGIDTLVRSLLDNGIAPNSNVYAELGSTWRFLMREPDAAAHALGKLFKYVGAGQRAVGHRLDLVRLAAGPDPGVPHVPDRTSRCAKRTATRRLTSALRAKVFG